MNNFKIYGILDNKFIKSGRTIKKIRRGIRCSCPSHDKLEAEAIVDKVLV